MSLSLRCLTCERLWPIEEEYLTCPVCQEHTENCVDVAMPESDARLQAAYGRFGWYLHEHDLV